MKTWNKKYLMVGLVFLTLLLFGCASQKVPVGEKTISSDANLRIVYLNLQGMTCSGCAWSAQNTLSNKKGVVSVDVDIETKSGSVVYDPNSISKEKLIDDPLIQSYNG